MTDDVTFNQVLSVGHTAAVLLERFPLLGIYLFCPRFYYNTFLVCNRMID